MLDQPVLVTMGYWESLPTQLWVSVRGVQDQLARCQFWPQARLAWPQSKEEMCGGGRVIGSVGVGGWLYVVDHSTQCTLTTYTTLNKHSCRSVGWELRDHTWSQLLHRCQLNSQSCNWMSWYSFNISVPPTVTMVTCSQTVWLRSTKEPPYVMIYKYPLSRVHWLLRVPLRY